MIMMTALYSFEVSEVIKDVVEKNIPKQGSFCRFLMEVTVLLLFGIDLKSLFDRRSAEMYQLPTLSRFILVSLCEY